MCEGLQVVVSPWVNAQRPWFTVAVLTWGDHLWLARRCLDSLYRSVPRDVSELLVAANAPSPSVRAWLETETRQGRVDKLLVSELNLFKNPMMREVIRIARGDDLWWFDDDSHITDDGAFAQWWGQVQASSPRVVGWGATAFARAFDGFQDMAEARAWVRQARWYRGIEPPGGTGPWHDWWFLTGGCWWMRLSALRAIDWPDPRLRHVAEDILLGEAVRQQGWHLANVLHPGVAISDAPRRGESSAATPTWEPWAATESEPKRVLAANGGPYCPGTGA
jgi:hypothetical protein